MTPTTLPKKKSRRREPSSRCSYFEDCKRVWKHMEPMQEPTDVSFASPPPIYPNCAEGADRGERNVKDSPPTNAPRCLVNPSCPSAPGSQSFRR